MSAERTICTTGFFDLSDGLNASGDSTSAVNTAWPAKRNQLTSATGTPLMPTRYLAVESSPAKQIVASAISPIASSLR